MHVSCCDLWSQPTRALSAFAMNKETPTLQPMDDAARALAHRLIVQSRHAALAVLQPETGRPTISRIGLATTGRGQPVTLVSELSSHWPALASGTVCALLLGEPGQRGDPLTDPRLSLQGRARVVPRDTDEEQAIRRRYLRLRPKAKLYADFADFRLVAFEVEQGLLVGGFGRVWELAPADLGL